MQKLSEHKIEEMFQDFLIALPDYMEDFIHNGKKDGYIFDYSLDSLSTLEEFAQRKVITSESVMVNDIAAYIGEVIIVNYGGGWRCSIENGPKSVSYGLPVVYGFNNYGLEFSPFEVVGVFVERPRKNHFFKSIQGYINPLEDELDLDDLPTEDY